MNRNDLLIGLGVGAGLMYIFDPDRGKRRRAQACDAVTHCLHVTEKALGKTARDFNHRLTGVGAEMSSLFRSDEPSDEVLVARIRAQVGRAVSHPHAVHVDSHEGKVILSGVVLAHEADALRKAVRNTQGVAQMEDYLEVHDKAENHPKLQGGKPRNGNRLEWMKTNWAPAPRVMAGAAGSLLTLYGSRRRDGVGKLLEIVGLGLVTRSLTNLEMPDIIGVSGGHGIHVQKTININAPIEKVYGTWRQHENFPQFMSRVLEVKDLGENRYHWKVIGPAGIPVEWDAVLTAQIPNKLLAWESEAGATIKQRGVVRFHPNDKGGTSVDVNMTYLPPAGVAGHIVAKMFGVDPHSEMTADLLRMKSFLETGHQPHDAAQREVNVRPVGVPAGV